jgi:hypothetical protein
MNELPIACSLTAGDLEARLAEIRAVGESALRERELDGKRVRLSFDLSDDVATRLRRIVDAEQECCAFLTLSLETRADAIVLTIEAPQGAELARDELADGFGAVAA